MAATLRDEGVLLSGRAIEEQPPHYLIGAVDTPVEPSPNWSPAPLFAKIEAGARFVQTQFCFDPALAKNYATALRSAGMAETVRLLIGLGSISSARSARWMRKNLFGVDVPDTIVDRLEKASDSAAEGRRICVELMQQMQDIPGVDGVHLMAVQDQQEIVRVLDESGLR